MIWTLHAKPQPNGKSLDRETLAEQLVAVPEAKSTFALLFPALWLVWHGLWLGFVALMIFTFTMLALLGTPYWWVPLAIFGLPGLYLWLDGNQLRRNKLDRKGYALVGVAQAGSEQGAVARFLAKDRNAASVGPITVTPVKQLPDLPPKKPAESFGMFGA